MLDGIKDKLTIKSISASVAAVVTLLGSIWAIDNHYASAADVSQVKRSVTIQLQQMRNQQLEDKLFELDFKREKEQLTPLDEAIYQRYRRQMDRNNRMLNNLISEETSE